MLQSKLGRHDVSPLTVKMVLYRIADPRWVELVQEVMELLSPLPARKATA